MTKAMKLKFEQAVKEFQSEMPDRYVNGWKFRHCGKTYRIEENEKEFKIFAVNTDGIYDTLVETVVK